jgi:hypothetical protein
MQTSLLDLVIEGQIDKIHTRNQAYKLPQHIKGTWNIHTFAQYTGMTSKVFFISIPISLEALQQHNPKSPNLVYNGRELYYIAQG